MIWFRLLIVVLATIIVGLLLGLYLVERIERRQPRELDPGEILQRSRPLGNVTPEPASDGEGARG